MSAKGESISINLAEVRFPNKLENLPQSTFYNCKKLAAVNFPSTLTGD